MRENPLVVRFVQEISLHPPSMLELAARVIRTSNITFEPHDVPKTLREYLSTAHHCVNPKCRGMNGMAMSSTLLSNICVSFDQYIDLGVFFDNRVEHIKFVDFCGKYRVPLLQYLCSSR